MTQGPRSNSFHYTFARPVGSLLREDPSARWGDMRSLLDALGRARARRRGLAVGIAVAGATVAVVAAATGAMAWRARGPDASRSEASPRRLVGWRDERPLSLIHISEPTRPY